ncbi:EAL domain-containing protein [Cryobacterium sp. TMT1-21]|uniref:EAL domain-containing protein n=1 Tax=Cryobacterium sp. TMT1-21 TaxID=1259234 RepID=UPI00106DC279|nr:EAL domain-containing protein [Cryobacterium sp. TMT1-21]TFD15591.1 EAL domain-containing protein [Cryobacterium sp. TMT1-21]
MTEKRNTSPDRERLLPTRRRPAADTNGDKTWSEGQFRALLGSAPDAMVIVDADGTILLVNAQVEVLFGYVRDELLGQSLEVLMPIEFRGWYLSHRSEYSAKTKTKAQARSMGPDLGLLGLHRDGREFPIEISLSPFETDSGTLVSSSIRDISERTQAQASTRMMSMLVASSDDAIFGYDVDGLITVWNPAAEAMFGFSAPEVIGQHQTLIVTVDGRDRGLELQAQVAGGESVIGLESVALHKDGSRIVDISLTISPIFDSRNIVAGCFGIARNISESKRRQIASETDQARLAAAQQMAGMGSYEIDSATGQRWWSDEYWRILGRNGTEPASRDLLLSCVHPQDRDRVESLLRRLDSGWPTPEFTFRIILQSGGIRWMRSRAVVIRAADGSPIKIIGMIMDITELHLAEARQQEAETNFRLGFDRSQIGMGMADLDGRLFQVNEALCTILGRTPEEIRGKRTQDFRHPSHHEGDRASFSGWLSGGFEDTQAELQYARPNGQPVWVQLTMSHVPDVNGEPGYFLLHMQDISSRKYAEDLLAHQALHDPLTGLPNRQLLVERIERSLSTGRRTAGYVGVLFIDVDQFKVINDGLGHVAGDRLLVGLTRRLKLIVRPGDTLARFGGDEFVLVCDNIAPYDAERLAERIVTIAKDPFEFEGKEVFVSVSVGIVLADDDADADASSMLLHSDVAMYRAKADGRARVVMYDEDMHHRASMRLETESQLARAISRDELRVFYQPIVDISTEETVGFEALVRWEHPDRGFISPTEFIPIAEQTGSIVAIGEWVLTEALRQVQAWRSQLAECHDLTIAVNLSARQLQDANFVQVVSDIITRSGIDASAVHLEITESMVINNLDLASATLSGLRGLGVRLSLDDFGTGWSSLTYLKQLPVQTIKIDRSFIDGLGGKDPQAPAFVNAIVSLARALEMDVVAEGIETREQLSELRRLGGSLAQGYLWSRPRPPKEIPGWLAEEKMRTVRLADLRAVS